MASTALKTDEEKKEFFDSPEELDEKITRLAEFIRNANHFVCFTGAGISTATGIKDYRSGKDTILEVGPGSWELAAMRQNAQNNGNQTTNTSAAKQTGAAGARKVSPKTTKPGFGAGRGMANKSAAPAKVSPRGNNVARVSPKGNTAAKAPAKPNPFATAKPSLTHMSLYELYRQDML